MLHTVLEQFADGIPERIQRAIRQKLDGESGTPPDTEWPGADNPRRPEAFADLQSWAEAHGPDAVLEAARADAYREAPYTIERRTWGSIRSALDTFGAEFVVDAVFSVVDGDVPTVDGQDRADWKRAFGSERATESPLPVYPESELPDERNGWELVGT